MRRFLPLLLAVAAALPVAFISGSIDARYEATASTRVQTLFGSAELTGLRRLAGLSDVGAPARSPLFPGGSSSLERVEMRTAQRVGRSAPLRSDDVRVIDTGAELVPIPVIETPRRLKVKAIADEPQAAARLADVYLAQYLEERKRSVDQLLSETRRRLRAASTPRISGISPAARAELIEATDIAIDLHGGLLTYDLVRARAPEERISPKPVRDTIVAGLIGALVGWLLGYARVPASRSNSSRLRSTIASRL